jgi:hypothetical protein
MTTKCHIHALAVAVAPAHDNLMAPGGNDARAPDTHLLGLVQCAIFGAKTPPLTPLAVTRIIVMVAPILTSATLVAWIAASVAESEL